MISKFFSDKSVRGFTIIGLVVLAFITLSYFNELGGYFGVLLIGDLFGILTSFTATILSFLVWRSFGSGEISRKIWGAMTLGIALWAFGEFLWGFYEIILKQEIPYPSLADVSWVLGYIPLAIGLYWRYKSYRVAPRRRQWVTLVIIYVVIIVVWLFAILLPIITYAEYESPIVHILDTLYPLSDLIILFFLLLIFFVLGRGQMSASWLVIAIGMMTLVVSDSMFSYGYWNEIYFPDGTINSFTIASDMIYYFSYLSISLGIYKELRTQRGH